MELISLLTTHPYYIGTYSLHPNSKSLQLAPCPLHRDFSLLSPPSGPFHIPPHHHSNTASCPMNPVSHHPTATTQSMPSALGNLPGEFCISFGSHDSATDKRCKQYILNYSDHILALFLSNLLSQRWFQFQTMIITLEIVKPKSLVLK